MDRMLAMCRSLALLAFALSFISVDARASGSGSHCYDSGNEGCVCCDSAEETCCFVSCPAGDGSVGVKWCDCCDEGGGCHGGNGGCAVE